MPQQNRGERMYFADFVFDRRAQTLWRGDEVVALRPKSAAVLEMLLDRGGEVVSKRALLAAVWPDGFVGDDVVAGCVRELRSVLGDDAKDPRFIATVHRRGYRAIAPVSLVRPAGGATDTFVGRQRELASMREWWNGLQTGGPQVAFIAGEAGIGKSTLIGRFVEELWRDEQALVGRGHCVEQLSGGEPYLPFLVALTGLCRDVGGDHVADVLRHHAPSWLAQLPGLVDGSESATTALPAGMKSARMMRELADALHALSHVRPVVIVCEDLQAADRSSIELLEYIARHPQPARLLVLCTYRPSEVLEDRHPVRGLVGDLRARRRCRFLALGPLTTAAVGDYLEQRLSPRRPSAELVADVAGRTEGNAVFLVALVDHLIARDLLSEAADGAVHSRGELWRSGIPETVRHVVERQLDEHKPDARRLLEVAAIAGVEFTAAAVSAGLAPADARATAEIEEELHALATASALIVPDGTAQWPDGTVTASYRFRHAMCREVLSSNVGSATRRAAIHRRITRRLSDAYGQRSSETAQERVELRLCRSEAANLVAARDLEAVS